MRKPLRIALDEIHRAGLRVTAIQQGGKHCEIILEGGRLIRLSKGSRVDSNFKKIMHDAVRRLVERAELP